MKIEKEKALETKINGDDQLAKPSVNKDITKQNDKNVSGTKKALENKSKTIQTAPVFLKNRKVPLEKKVVEDSVESIQTPLKTDSPLPKGQKKLTDMFKKKEPKSKPVLATLKPKSLKLNGGSADTKSSSGMKMDVDVVSDENRKRLIASVDQVAFTELVVDVDNSLGETKPNAVEVNGCEKITVDMVSKVAVGVSVNDEKKLNSEPPSKKPKLSNKVPKTPTRKSSRETKNKKVETQDAKVTPKNKRRGPKTSTKSSEKKKKTDDDKQKKQEERKKIQEQKALEKKRKLEEDRKKREEEKVKLQKKKEAEKEERLRKKKEEEEARKQKKLEEAEKRRKRGSRRNWRRQKRRERKRKRKT